MSRTKTSFMWLLALSMVGVGVAHFVVPGPFEMIVPDWLPAPLWLVWISGVFEILGGLGLLLPRTRVLAAWGLIALFIAVFPANLHQAMHGIQFDPANPMPPWAAWARLPLQLVFIAWAHWLTRPTATQAAGKGRDATAVGGLAGPG